MGPTWLFHNYGWYTYLIYYILYQHLYYHYCHTSSVDKFIYPLWLMFFPFGKLIKRIKNGFNQSSKVKLFRLLTWTQAFQNICSMEFKHFQCCSRMEYIKTWFNYAHGGEKSSSKSIYSLSWIQSHDSNSFNWGVQEEAIIFEQMKYL